jgi:hypothetical protein
MYNPEALHNITSALYRSTIGLTWLLWSNRAHSQSLLISLLALLFLKMRGRDSNRNTPTRTNHKITALPGVTWNVLASVVSRRPPFLPICCASDRLACVSAGGGGGGGGG